MAAGRDEAGVPVDGGQREVVGADEAGTGHLVRLERLGRRMERGPVRGRLQAGRLEQVLAVEVDHRATVETGDAEQLVPLADHAGLGVEDAHVVQVRIGEVVEVPVRGCLGGIVPVRVQLEERAVLHVARGQEAEVLDELERGLGRGELLGRLGDERVECERADLQLDARLFLELGQQVGERTMVVLAPRHEDAELGSGVLHRVIGRILRGHPARR
jgi:hypothetical protein